MNYKTKDNKIGVMICGHGSRSQAAVDEFAQITEKLPVYLPDQWPIDYGYLEFANPVIYDGLDKLRRQGCKNILAVPVILLAAMHSKNDIPTVLNTYAGQHNISVLCGRELGVDAKMLIAAAARIQAAVNNANNTQGAMALTDTVLVVIGRGTSDPDANSNVAKIARMLWEGMGFGWCEVGYSGVTFPLVEPCLDHVAKLGYRRIIVFPYFLFSGILIDRIYGFSDKCAAKYPHLQIIKAHYLGDHPMVLQTISERVIEQIGEIPPDNCGLCKYRTQILGFEGEVGRDQSSHHHHVEGQGASAVGSNVQDCQLCIDFCTGECRLDHHHHRHDHHHTHPNYPQVDHPLGPKSVRS